MTRIQLRRSTAAQWTAANPTLAAGEIGFETDTGNVKIGDGSTAWVTLVYLVDAAGGSGLALPVATVDIRQHLAAGRVEGVTDDAAALTAAIAALPADGGTIILGKIGLHLALGSTVSLSKPVALQGAGKLNTTIHLDGNKQFFADADGVRFTDLTISGRAVSGDRIFDNTRTVAKNCKGWRFDRVKVVGTATQFAAIGRLNVDGTFATAGTDHAADIALIDSEFTGVVAAYTVEAGGIDGFVMDRCHVHDSGVDTTVGEGIKIIAGTKNFRIVNNHIHHNSRDGIDAYDSLGGLISGNDIHDNGVGGIEAKWAVSDGHTVDKFLIANNRIYSNAVNGMNVPVGRSIVIGNEVYSNGGSGIRFAGSFDTNADTASRNTIIIANVSTGNTGDGIALTGGKYAVISGNQCSGNTGYGIATGTASSTFIITNNQCFDNTAGIRINGTGHRVLNNQTQDADGNATVDLVASTSVVTDATADITAGFLKGGYLPRFTAKVATGQNVKVTFIGDSGLEGSTTTTPGTDDTASLFCTDLAARFGITVTKSNRAVSGHCTYWHLMPSILSPTRFANALTDLSDLYVIAFGHNDIRSDLSSPGTGYPLTASLGAIEHMIRRIRVTVPGADILISDEWPYTGTSSGSNTYLAPHAKGLRRVAAHYGCAFVSFTAALAARLCNGSTPAVDDVYIWPTGETYAQHPTSAGARVWADAMLQFIPVGVRPSAAPSANNPPLGVYTPQRYGSWTSYVTSAGAGVRTPGTDGYRLVTSGNWSSPAAAPSTTTTANDYIDAQFIGTEASFRLDTGASQATVKINVDAVDVYASLDLSAYSAGQSRIPIVGLTPGYHRIVITVLSGSLTFRGYDVLSLPCTKFKWDSPRITYTGTWTEPSTDATKYYGTSKNTIVVNDSFAVDFVGTALASMGVKYTTGATYGVVVDGVAMPDVTSIGAGTPSTAGVVFVSGLSFGRHTAVVSAKALSGGRALNVSGLIVYDESRLDRSTRARGLAKVAEVVTFATPLPGVPAVTLSPADATSAVPPYPSAVTVDGLTVNGTAAALVQWEAETGRNAW